MFDLKRQTMQYSLNFSGWSEISCFSIKVENVSNFFAILYVTTLYASIILRLFKRQMTFCSIVIPHMLINAPKVSLFSFFVLCASQIFFLLFCKNKHSTNTLSKMLFLPTKHRKWKGWLQLKRFLRLVFSTILRNLWNVGKY